MLSWDEFDKEDPTEAKAAPAAAQAAAQGHDKLDDEAAGSVEEARAVSADDSDAVARAKKALNDLDIQEGLDDLEGSAARVQVGDKQMINARADLNQLVPQVRLGLAEVSGWLRQPLDAAGSQHERRHRPVEEQGRPQRRRAAHRHAQPRLLLHRRLPWSPTTWCWPCTA